MARYLIRGGKILQGEIQIFGNKNAVLPIMAASIVVNDILFFKNVPQINDVMVMADILRYLGADVVWEDEHSLKINTRNINKTDVPSEFSSKLRASVLLMGPLYGRFGEAKVYKPGGDSIGRRSIDTHLECFKQLGASVIQTHEYVQIKRDRKPNSKIILDEPSVTGTENIVMASLCSENRIELVHVAEEPHVQDLLLFLQACGSDVKLHPANRISVKHSVLSGKTYTIMPDYVEAGTYAVLSALLGSKVRIAGCNPELLELPLLFLSRMGVRIQPDSDGFIVEKSEVHSISKTIQAMPHPGFPTDLISPFIVLATQADGETLLHDPLYESRMFFVDKLIQMGANITICDPHRILVLGKTSLIPGNFESPDIRAGIALIIAALIAKGESVIHKAEIVERGYEHLDLRLSALGASITRYD
jgi:UDP-N-acetylglucosamine 1-carboxyvinyltransferase